jgi:hypothetical protein
MDGLAGKRATEKEQLFVVIVFKAYVLQEKKRNQSEGRAALQDTVGFKN